MHELRAAVDAVAVGGGHGAGRPAAARRARRRDAARPAAAARLLARPAARRARPRAAERPARGRAARARRRGRPVAPARGRARPSRRRSSRPTSSTSCCSSSRRRSPGHGPAALSAALPSPRTLPVRLSARRSAKTCFSKPMSTSPDSQRADDQLVTHSQPLADAPARQRRAAARGRGDRHRRARARAAARRSTSSSPSSRRRAGRARRSSKCSSARRSRRSSTGLATRVHRARPRGRARVALDGRRPRSSIDAPRTARGAQLGDSVAIDGVCLTVVASTAARSRSTPCRRRSRARRSASSRPEPRVNLEPALRAGEPLGGHYVQGHVDGVGTRPQRRAGRRRRRIWFDAPPSILRYVVEKGSIAVEGTSLTVAARRRRRLRGRADPAHARGDDARRRSQPGDAGEPRGRRAREVRREAAPALACRDDEPCTDAVRDRSRRRSRRSARAGSSSSSTTRTARTRATSSIAAQFATPEAINFMATHARGLICLCLTEERADQLGLRPMTDHNEAPLGTAFTVSRRGARGRDDRHLGRRPQPHDPGRDPSGRDAARPRPARPRLPAAREAGRRARAHRPDRGGGRPRAPRRPQPVRRRLRDHERGRDDGPRRPTSSRTASGTA